MLQTPPIDDPRIDAAIAEIEGIRQHHKGWRDLDGQANALSERAHPLKMLLKSPEIATSVSDYLAASREADSHKRKQRGIGRYAALFGFAATVVSGAMLFLHLPQGTLGAWGLQLLHFMCLGSALASAFYLRLSKPASEWGRARLRAESCRLAHFERIHDAARTQQQTHSDSLPANLLALEYVRAYLIEDQRDWHRRRARDFVWTVRGITALRWLGVLFLVIAMVPIISSMVMPLFGSISPSLDSWTEVARRLISPERAALAGVFGGALQTLATSLSALSLAERNRRSFLRVADVLTAYLSERLPDARLAAMRGDDLGVERFWSSVRTELAAENRAWNEALGAGSAIVLNDISHRAGGHS